MGQQCQIKGVHYRIDTESPPPPPPQNQITILTSNSRGQRYFLAQSLISCVNVVTHDSSTKWPTLSSRDTLFVSSEFPTQHDWCKMSIQTVTVTKNSFKILSPQVGFGNVIPYVGILLIKRLKHYANWVGAYDSGGWGWLVSYLTYTCMWEKSGEMGIPFGFSIPTRQSLQNSANVMGFNIVKLSRRARRQAINESKLNKERSSAVCTWIVMLARTMLLCKRHCITCGNQN